mgnify:CR=1 FL=1
MQVVGVAIGSGVVNCSGFGYWLGVLGGWRAYQWVWWGLYMRVYAGLRCASYPGFLAFGWLHGLHGFLVLLEVLLVGYCSRWVGLGFGDCCVCGMGLCIGTGC